MDPNDRASDVAADMARWTTTRWCHCRISASKIDAIVLTIDPTRKPRTSVVQRARDAARLSLQLYDDFCTNRDLDNARVSELAKASSSALRDDPEAHAVAARISGAAWAARDAIGEALHAITADCPTGSFMFRHVYASPVYAFDYRARSRLIGVHQPSPYLGVTELYLAGCYPIGYVDDHFVVFAP